VKPTLLGNKHPFGGEKEKDTLRRERNLISIHLKVEGHSQGWRHSISTPV